MLLQPRYGSDPVVVLDGSPGDIAVPSIRQRERLLSFLKTLSNEQWNAPSRCEGWTVRDCMVHLESTNTFWEMSIRAGLAGTPTKFLASFDPAASPAAMVAVSELSPSDLIDKVHTSAQSLNELLASLHGQDWEVLAEAPPGHITVSAVAHHALWDSWVHERYDLLPLGINVAEEPDEIEACLRYASALAVSFAVHADGGTTATFSVEVAKPAVSFDVTMGNVVAITTGAPSALVAAGDAIELLEAVSRRVHYGNNTPESIQRAFDGLARAFDQIDD